MADIIELYNGKGKATHRYIPRKKRIHDFCWQFHKYHGSTTAFASICPACRGMIQTSAKKKHKDDNQAFKRLRKERVVPHILKAFCFSAIISSSEQEYVFGRKSIIQGMD